VENYLSLQWRDVDLKRKEIRLSAAKTKDQDYRAIPVSSRLAAVLEMGKTDPAGKDFGAGRVRVRGRDRATREECQEGVAHGGAEGARREGDVDG
jgi:integrase